ncbi:MAG: phage Gp37/Gp68 family protein [Bacteroidota bacterium]
MQLSTIEWTDRTWNPVSGCTKVSQGCKNCYAQTLYERFNGKGSFGTIKLNHHKLTEPVGIKKPSKIFVNSMSDLFHEQVPFSFIDTVFNIMGQCHWHTFQVLTKRPKRMYDYYFSYREPFNPIPDNVWLGVSVEDQATANERIPILLDIPAKTRFISAEPLLDSFNLFSAYDIWLEKGNRVPVRPLRKMLHWVIAGGESGSGARPLSHHTVIKLQQECEINNIPFFFKQWGEYFPINRILTSKEVRQLGNMSPKKCITIGDTDFLKVGKKAAGSTLNGQEYKQFPTNI